MIALSALAYALAGIIALRMARTNHPELFVNTGGVVGPLILIGGPCSLAVELLDRK